MRIRELVPQFRICCDTPGCSTHFPPCGMTESEAEQQACAQDWTLVWEGDFCADCTAKRFKEKHL